MIEHKLPSLPFAKNALIPFLSEEAFEYHWGKHHATYVNKLNELIKGTKLENTTLEDLVKQADGAVFNNAAQHWNHSFFWNCLTPKRASKMPERLQKALDENFSSFAKFKELFSKEASTVFGSGWTWLVKNGSTLEIISTANAGCPIREGKKPLLTLDVWEHAYYVDYRNNRPKFIEEWWNYINWDFVAKNL